MWLPLSKIIMHMRFSLRAAGRERCKASEAARTASRRGIAQGLFDSPLRRHLWQLVTLARTLDIIREAKKVIIALLTSVLAPAYSARCQHESVSVAADLAAEAPANKMKTAYWTSP